MGNILCCYKKTKQTPLIEIASLNTENVQNKSENIRIYDNIYNFGPFDNIKL